METPQFIKPLAIITVFIIAVLVLAAIIVLFCFAFKYDERKNLAARSRNNKVFTYNYAKKSFMYFEKMNTTVQLQQTHEEFLAKFDPADKYQVENWLNDIAMGKQAPAFLNANIKDENKRNKLIPIILELKSINREKDIIHFETLRVQYAAAQKNVSKSKARKYRIEDKDACQEFLSERNKTTSLGAVYYVNVYDTDEDQAYEDDLETIYEKSLNIIVSYMSKTRKYTIVDYDSLLIMDINCLNRAAALAFASTLETSIRQYINTSFPDTTIKFTIGVVTGNNYNNDLDLAIKLSKQMSDAVKEAEGHSPILVYDPNYFDLARQKKNDLAEIKYLISNDTYRIYYRPFVNTNTFTLNHYSATIVPHGTRIKDFLELVVFALANKLDIAKLYNSIIGQITKRVERKDESECIVAIRLPLSTVDLFIKEAKKFKDSKVRWFFVFNESYLLMYSESQKKTAKKLQDLKDSGYLLGIQITSPNSALSNLVLSRADTIIVPADIFQYSFKDPNINHSLRLVQNAFAELNMPITYTHLKTISEISLCHHYGGSIFMADEIGKPSSRLEGIDNSVIQALMREIKD